VYRLPDVDRTGWQGTALFLQVSDGSEVAARTVVVATGVTWRRLDVPGLDALRGAGVYYGAAGAEAPATEGGDVFVVGLGTLPARPLSTSPGTRGR
jgi:thioredoxin reductase (NADPH)